MKRFHIFFRGSTSGRVMVELRQAANEDEARASWGKGRVPILAIEEVPLGALKPVDPEARLNELLAKAAPAANSEPAKPPAKKPALSLECWRDPQTEPIDAEAAMRAVRVACGGDPEKGRRQG